MSAYFLAAVGVSAGITFFLRALPFILFNGERKMPEWMTQLGAVLPPAIMAVLIVYCLRGARGDLVHAGIPGGAAVAATAALYRWKRMTLPSIIFGTAVYMIMIRVMG